MHLARSINRTMSVYRRIIIGVIYPMATLAIYQLISRAGNVETAPFLSGPLSFRFCVQLPYSRIFCIHDFGLLFSIRIRATVLNTMNNLAIFTHNVERIPSLFWYRRWKIVADWIGVCLIIIFNVRKYFNGPVVVVIRYRIVESFRGK